MTCTIYHRRVLLNNPDALGFAVIGQDNDGNTTLAHGTNPAYAFETHQAAQDFIDNLERMKS